MGFGVFGGDDDGGGDLVVGVEVEELDAGGGAAGGADGLGVDADDLAELGDEHHLGGVVDEVDGGDLADLFFRGAGPHGDDALAAARLEAVGVDAGALAEAVLGDGEDEAWGEAETLVEAGELGGGLGGDFGVVGAEDLLAAGGIASHPSRYGREGWGTRHRIGFVNHSFDIGAVPVGSGKLFLIAGPCVIESEMHARMLADSIQRTAADLGIPYIFKASYDKANRTSIRSFRGPGLVEGARILRAIAQSNGLPILTDVHTPEDCLRLSKALGDVEAVLQIPAFLCRQTDLLIAAAHTGRAINVKKGQFVAPLDMQHAVLKVRDSVVAGKAARVMLTERGASFGYNNLVVDMRSLPIDAAVRAGGLRRDALGADALGGQWRERRAAGVYRGAGAGGGGGGSGWGLPGGA